MVVRIRLARKGTRNNPFYHIVAINDSKPRDARPIEKLGEYDPIPRLPVSTSRLPTPFLGSGAGASKTTAKTSTSTSASAPGAKPTKTPTAQQDNIPGKGGLMTTGLASPESKDQQPAKRLEWNQDRITHWLKLGAQPSKPVARLLDRAGLVPAGVHYKGIYRPSSPPTAGSAPTTAGPGPAKST
ncbi:ribosomal protein S16 [Testicularia cyperi]|uniref:Ribosomal protein S16 n=1 Tax=Testicularia cyperi TaxID=1882483 RepID=A0A317XXM2_9BASI|nr:ribosomal protein S16 [Testicularia cyperi]